MTEQQMINYENAPDSPVHRKIYVGGYLAWICHGYVLGIVGIALSLAKEPLGLTSYWMGLIGAGALIGILFGSLITGSIADSIGRRALYLTSMLASTVLSLSQLFISDPAVLAAVRLLLGMTIGWDYAAAVALISEWTPLTKRARTLGMLVVFWTVGYVISYIVGVILNSIGEVDWRLVLCTSAIPAIVTFIVRLGTPESPAWLAKKGRIEEGLALIHKYLGEQFTLPPLEDEAASASWSRLFSKSFRYNTIVAGVFFACQVLPFFAISLFLPLVLSNLKMDNPYASGVIYNVCTMIGVLIGSWLMDRISRRSFLLWTFYGSAAILFIIVVWSGMPGYLALSLVAALSLVLAICIVIELAYPPELFPTELRGSGVGLAIAISRVGAAGGTFLLPIITENFGIYVTLAGCVGVLLLGGIICHMWAAETSPKFIKESDPKVDGIPVPKVAVCGIGK